MCWCTRWDFQFFLVKLSSAWQEMGKVAIKATHLWGKILTHFFCYRLPCWSISPVQIQKKEIHRMRFPWELRMPNFLQMIFFGWTKLLLGSFKLEECIQFPCLCLKITKCFCYCKEGNIRKRIMVNLLGSYQTSIVLI